MSSLPLALMSFILYKSSQSLLAGVQDGTLTGLLREALSPSHAGLPLHRLPAWLRDKALT